MRVFTPTQHTHTTCLLYPKMLHPALIAVASLALTPASVSQMRAPRPAHHHPQMSLATPAWVIGTVGAGASGAVFVVKNLEPWYASLDKPSWSPPNNVFAPVWSTLYAMIGVASARAFGMSPLAATTRRAFDVYAIHAVLNLAWAPIFFGLHKLRLGFVVSVALFTFAIWTALEFMAISGGWTALLLPHCMAWRPCSTPTLAAQWPNEMRASRSFSRSR